MQEVTVGGQSILEAREEGGTREEPEEAAGGKFFSVTHLTVSWRATGKSTGLPFLEESEEKLFLCNLLVYL